MAEWTLERLDGDDFDTVGALLREKKFVCFVLEDRYREKKVMHETRIKAGRYEMIISMSKRFGRLLPELLGVPDFTGIRIHGGTKAEDTSGCLLAGFIAYCEPGMKSELHNCKGAVEKIIELMKLDQSNWLTIIDRDRA